MSWFYDAFLNSALPTRNLSSVFPVFGERRGPLALLALLGEVLVPLRLDPLPDGPLAQRLALVRQLGHLLLVYLVLNHLAVVEDVETLPHSLTMPVK